jgi:hypothetical protein
MGTYITVGERALTEEMVAHIEEFEAAYVERYGRPIDLVGNLITTSQNYQLLRGYLLGKGYSFAEIDAPDGLWALTRSTNV